MSGRSSTGGLGRRLAGWLLGRWRVAARRSSRLSLIERIPLGPRQALYLVEAEGMHLLVATAVDGTPAFYPLPTSRGRDRTRHTAAAKQAEGRISW